jgi:hypothetical protein
MLVKAKRNLKLIFKSACLVVEKTAKLPLLCRAELFAKTKILRKQKRSFTIWIR